MKPSFMRWVAPAYQISALQLLLGGVMVIGWGMNSALSAYSAGLGVLISVVPQLFFAQKVFAKQGARAARQIVNALYVGETLKWALTIALLIVVFINMKPLDAVALISTFALTQLVVPLLALLIMKKT